MTTDQAEEADVMRRDAPPHSERRRRYKELTTEIAYQKEIDKIANEVGISFDPTTLVPEQGLATIMMRKLRTGEITKTELKEHLAVLKERVDQRQPADQPADRPADAPAAAEEEEPAA